MERGSFTVEQDADGVRYGSYTFTLAETGEAYEGAFTAVDCDSGALCG